MADAEVTEAIGALDGARGVGVLVPPSNPVIEPELGLLLPPALRLHAVRLPVMPDTTLQERNRRYPGTYAAALEGFGGMALEAAVVGLTGPCYRLLPEGDRAVAEGLSRPGRPVQTASGAILEALGALGCRRLCLLSPYPQWLTDEAAAYWTAAGYDVVQVVKVSNVQSAYELTSAQVAGALRDALAQVRGGGAEAVVMSGTGMITLPAILAARQETAAPILSSNICCAWWLARTLGIAGASSPILAAVAPELAAA